MGAGLSKLWRGRGVNNEAKIGEGGVTGCWKVSEFTWSLGIVFVGWQAHIWMGV